MLLSEFIENATTARQYLERYVNDGSPSGYSTIHTTSSFTNQFSLNPWFYPYICIAPINYFEQFGTIPSFPAEDSSNEANNWIIIHPDMVNNLYPLPKDFKIRKCKNLKVMPTSSGRTVQIINRSGQDFIKLHYDGILGRVKRDLPFRKAIAGPELSQYITSAIDNKLLGSGLTLFPETGARSLIYQTNNKKHDVGMVWRENKPYQLDENKIIYLFPVFSLFSYDRLSIHHPSLIKQIIEYNSTNPVDFIFDVVIVPLLRCYFDLICKLGVLAEWNSQNIIIGFDKHFEESTFIMRDLESCDKDLAIMRSLKISKKFESYPYKCVEDTNKFYSIKHSFMFDFKLGESIIDPLLLVLQDVYNININQSRNKVKDIAKIFINELPPNYFPKNKWFSFDDVLVDLDKKERPYVENSNPKFRF